MKKTGEYSLENGLIEYYDTILYTLKKAATLSETQDTVDEAGMHTQSFNERSEALYKHHLAVLYRLVRPKLDYSEEVDVDEELRSEIESAGVRDLSLEDCDELLTTLQNLLEDIGVTRLEAEDWDTQGV